MAMEKGVQLMINRMGMVVVKIVGMIFTKLTNDQKSIVSRYLVPNFIRISPQFYNKYGHCL